MVVTCSLRSVSLPVSGENGSRTEYGVSRMSIGRSLVPDDIGKAEIAVRRSRVDVDVVLELGRRTAVGPSRLQSPRCSVHAIEGRCCCSLICRRD